VVARVAAYRSIPFDGHRLATILVTISFTDHSEAGLEVLFCGAALCPPDTPRDELNVTSGYISFGYGSQNEWTAVNLFLQWINENNPLRLAILEDIAEHPDSRILTSVAGYSDRGRPPTGRYRRCMCWDYSCAGKRRRCGLTVLGSFGTIPSRPRSVLLAQHQRGRQTMPINIAQTVREYPSA
jgi:hypothetical protein